MLLLIKTMEKNSALFCRYIGTIARQQKRHDDIALSRAIDAIAAIARYSAAKCK
jgi:hypothetical protein